MRYLKLVSLLVMTGVAHTAVAAVSPFVPSGTVIRIWPGEAPGSEGKATSERWIEGATPDSFHRVTDIHIPTLTVYLPTDQNSKRAAVIIAPGGAHRYLVVDLEGELVAKELNEMGVAAFVLRYRLAGAEGSTYRVEKESLADLHQAIRVVRGRAEEWQINPSRVGVMGFSAGGQLAALAQNEFEAITRPDFAVLAYAAFGANGAPAVSAKAPPTFLYVNDDDSFATGVGEYYLSLRAAKIPAEFHVFRRGGHGTGMTGRGPESGFDKLGAAKWPELLQMWMADLGLLR